MIIMFKVPCRGGGTVRRIGLTARAYRHASNTVKCPPSNYSRSRQIAAAACGPLGRCVYPVYRTGRCTSDGMYNTQEAKLYT